MVERYPVNDYAHFCLGRSLEKTGRIKEARRHAALAANLRPDRSRLPALPRPAARPRSPRAASAPSTTRPSSAVHAALVEPRHGRSPCTQMSRERAHAKRTWRVWRFHSSSCQGSRSSGRRERERLHAQQPVGHAHADLERPAARLARRPP